MTISEARIAGALAAYGYVDKGSVAVAKKVIDAAMPHLSPPRRQGTVNMDKEVVDLSDLKDVPRLLRMIEKLAQAQQSNTARDVEVQQRIAELELKTSSLALAVDTLMVELAATRAALSDTNQKSTRAVNALIKMGNLKP